MEKQTGRQRLGSTVFTAIVIVLLAACGSTSSASQAPSSTVPARTSTSTPPQAPVVSTAQVLQDVAAAPSITQLPGDLTPSLENAAADSGFAILAPRAVSYTHLRAHETGRNLVC